MTLGMVFMMGIVSFTLAYVTFYISRAFGLKGLYSGGNADLMNINSFKLFFYLCVLAPISEELMFRLVLFGILAWLGFGLVPTILISSIIFGLAHCSDFPQVPVPQLTAGVILGMVYTLGGLWAAIGVHAIHNLIAGFQILILRSLQN